MKTLFHNIGGDGSHCGISDLYPERQKLVEAALASGLPFDTGWYASKKEICSGRIYSDGKTVVCEVSVSDDFDAQGRGEAIATPEENDAPVTFADVVRALDDALDRASDDKRDNEPYAGFSVFTSKGWVETLILPKGYGAEMDAPPGDYYSKWEWQGECRYMPRKVRAVFLCWANNWLMGKRVGGKRTVAGWTIKPWKDKA